VEIIWAGHSCFRIKGKKTSIITDPFDKSIGYSLGKATANIVTISIDLPDHNNAGAVAGNPMIIDGPGEYEVAGVLITGIAFPTSPNGPRNTVYVMELDDLRLCHLGDLDRVPGAELIETLNSMDVLMVPVGGRGTLNASKAAETISLLDPKLVIPMHYKTRECQMELDPVDRFLKEMGIKELAPQPKVHATKSNLPSEGTQVVVMEPKG
jgi:L-ascorbate metabolism protein UlaG (beta-lactamase superfamily)